MADQDVVAEFYRAEADWWRARAERLLAGIKEAFDVARKSTIDGIPPEPPIGTQFVHQRTGSVEWTRRDDGCWWCGPQMRPDHGKDCRNCPVDWFEVAELLEGRVGQYVRRVLPGEADGA